MKLKVLALGFLSLMMFTQCVRTSKKCKQNIKKVKKMRKSGQLKM